MFEHVMLTGSPKGKRVWTTCAGVTGQMLLVAGMVVAPMVWPEAMPTAVFTMLAPTAPPGREAKADPEARPPVHPAPIRKTYHVVPTGLVQPVSVPAKIEILTDKYEIADVGPTRPAIGVLGGDKNGSGSRLLRDFLDRAQSVYREERRVDPISVATPAAVPAQRVTIGGLVDPPRLVYRVEPRYPQLALTSHVEGVVNLKGVIAIDGHIAELAIENGNPLLAPAALEAVRQWRYTATRLNGVPVEVMTTIAVTFRLNR